MDCTSHPKVKYVSFNRSGFNLKKEKKNLMFNSNR